MPMSSFKRKIKAIQIKIASPDVIRSWSGGEVKKPETINYRTFKPERDGLFCERIFGPVKDYECACGKYKGKKYEGTVCERCGVRVESREARRKRMGHIELAAPAVHIWYLESIPSVLGTLLNMNVSDLENIIYYGSRRVIERAFIVTDPKDTPFAQGDIIYETEYRIYRKKWDFEVEQAFIVKNPRSPVLSDIDGEVILRTEKTVTGREITWIIVRNVNRAEHTVLPGMIITVKDGQEVEKGQDLTREMNVDPLYAPFDGHVEIDEISNTITVKPLTTSKDQPVVFTVPYGARVLVSNGQKVKKGDQLTTSTTLPAVKASISGRVKFGSNLNVRALEDGNFEVLSSGNVYIEQVIEERKYPVFEGALVYVNNGDQVKKGDHLADRFLFEEEYLSSTEYKIFESHYPTMFDVEERTENDRPIVVITDIDPEVSKETGLKMGDIITENEYEAYLQIYPEKIVADAGAQAIKKLLQNLDLEELRAELEAELKKLPASSSKAMKLRRRLKMVKDFIKSGNKPEWMVLEVVPVIPPDLRPMIQIEGGRFATTDLNELYRRLINRNNRLRKLLELGAPEIILRNEKRMLQEAVDALIHNGSDSEGKRSRRAVLKDRNGRPLKSLTDLLKGKKGRFRRNLLGKRVDYSGRAVIVVGPHLKIHQCGIPKKMAMELFKPFVLAKLLGEGSTSKTMRKVKKAIIEKEMPEAWEVLEEVIKGSVVLLNRAPTLHRMSIQAFEPKLVEGNAIQLHPVVCPPFNADFDGDQMAVHVPLSAAAQAEARFLMLSRYNIISPAHGKPISLPTQDIIIGSYYLTTVGKDFDSLKEEDIRWRFSSPEEAMLAYHLGYIKLHTPILIKVSIKGEEKRIKTTLGRVIFNSILPEDLRDYNRIFDKKQINALVYETFKRYGIDRAADLLDDVKDLGFHYATVSGLTLSLKDLKIPPERDEILKRTWEKVRIIEENYERGFLTEEQRKSEIIRLWMNVTEEITELTSKTLAEDPFNPIYMMVNSGARGNIDQVKQLAGIRGLMIKAYDPRSREIKSKIFKGQAIHEALTFDYPVDKNLREGVDILQFFISTYGARKGQVDTAMNTSFAGYLTRRLVDVAQSVTVTEPDCGTHEGIRAMDLIKDGTVVEKMNEFLFGRVLASDVLDPETKEVLKNPETGKEYTRNTMLTDDDANFLASYKKMVDVVKYDEIDITELSLPNMYAEIAEPVGEYKEGTELTWDVVKAARNEGKYRIKVKMYPVVGTVYANEQPLYDKKGERELLVYQEVINEVVAKLLEENGVEKVLVRPDIIVRSPLTCESEYGVCAACYGMDLSNHKIVNVGEAVGIVAAQSIGEPGTQLTMRTFHVGGVMGASDIVSGLTTVEKTFEPYAFLREEKSGGKKEIRKYYGSEAVLCEVDGFVKDIATDETGRTVIYIEDYAGGIHAYRIPKRAKVKVKKGQKVLRGDTLTTGAIVWWKLLELESEKGVLTAMNLLKIIKNAYVQQGVSIHDKHFEIIFRQMLSMALVIDPGDSDYLPDQLVPLVDIKRTNREILEGNARVEENRKWVIGKMLAKRVITETDDGELVELAQKGEEVTEELLKKFIEAGIKEIDVVEKDRVVTYQILPKEPIKYKRRLLSLKKAALNYPGWLSAAAFEETAWVLTAAAIEGKVDPLIGLKENVIVGQLIPAGTGLDVFAGIQVEETPRAAAEEKLA
ncbi:DNA-directed RNA polymerase subunit beta' [Thermotoga neapolitana]|uniref:DNA-directed RNA polymerase subunit beta' n=1 Tax=Thermotoga neapolitana (strain ATCC 49049 / DSM 4359 / NBRC 107923 / NS-E) TaxID=309803 RepID=RPOC_THENN|nr:DNA-directed RNA polymerase subunit beta' [Thermotoga neapolitana]B9KBJ4.1 RecName: Full=DNA-directed RNA polymerase subunit beta'; Short=RNAP subunit beta'; AltName: Full=RNA polymerase subunit beta'; AltName: Full=Transcriptase subunit beta' [Thermotoga neapolitana DSM 4359]ACM22390.1 DNA-directed RNA polymerase subunit beta' [Thermotoga neapolitana DSM 4359]KFZ22503.1 DNA-directed RNA polymerase subunit beta' [Thermotoga neapolitana LA10]HBF11205.1 DNA-directed RNA polymerase subunit beta